MIDLEPIKARAEKATPGLWGMDWHQDPIGRQLYRSLGPIVSTEAAAIDDAAFLHTARADLLALIAEVERLREEIKEPTTELESLKYMLKVAVSSAQHDEILRLRKIEASAKVLAREWSVGQMLTAR